MATFITSRRRRSGSGEIGSSRGQNRWRANNHCEPSGDIAFDVLRGIYRFRGCDRCVTREAPSQSQLTWFDENGKEQGRIGAAGVLANPALLPDGKWVAFDSEDFKADNVDVKISDLERGGSSRFTFDPVEEVMPVWSRDGSIIGYRKISPLAVHLKKANGLEPDHAPPGPLDPSDDLIPNGWAPGDHEVLCTEQPSKGNYKLMLVPVDGSKSRLLLNGSGNQTNGQFSPDGKWVAYASGETGEREIYVANYPGAAGKLQVSRGGGSEPRWSGDRSSSSDPAKCCPGLTSPAARVFPRLFHARCFRSIRGLRSRQATYSTMTSAATERRFLVNQYIQPDRPTPLSIILNADCKPPR
jgi:hypothetical protein